MFMNEDVYCRVSCVGEAFMRAEADEDDEDGEAGLYLSPYWREGTIGRASLEFEGEWGVRRIRVE